ncbi:MAG: YfbK domain-containing protein [Chitinophagaceae bacterium]
MKNLLAIIYCLISLQASAQYYLRGVVRDEKNNILPNVKIVLSSKGNNPYFTGYSGSFGIPLSLLNDTITLSLDGYETVKQSIQTNKFQTFVMKQLAGNASFTKNHLLSFTKNFSADNNKIIIHSNESYRNLEENDFVDANKYSETGLSLNIDRASYSNIRRFLNEGSIVPPDAVRIEEMLNYFDFRNKNADTVLHSFYCSTQLTSAPWRTNNQLLFINLQAPKLNLDAVPPGNFIFLIDVSGSMDDPHRLPLLQSAFKLLVQNLRAQDSVAIVTYGGSVSVLLEPTSGNEKQKIIDAINKLVANGDTPGEAAIRTAYALAERSFNKAANNRIILATDGDFNVGQTSEEDLENLVSQHRQTGIYLTCLGVGMGNYKDSKLETLATKGNGNFAYIDNLQEAEKILITEFTKTMYAVANDAYLSVQFNPELVKNYRLIGFDNKQNALADSTSQLQGGEIGSGHSLMAVFEIEPADKNVTTAVSTNSIQHIAWLKLHYKLPGKKEEFIQSFTAPFNYQNIQLADSSLRFAASVAMFGELLKQSVFAKDYSWEDVMKLAVNSININNTSQQEYLGLIEKAKKIYPSVKRRKKAIGKLY